MYLRHPNYFVMESKVKFDNAITMLFSFVDSSQNWLFSFYIKSGYHHIDIFPHDHEFLGFSWFKDGFTQFYKFTVLPFGLPTGPYIFTKVMRPLVRYWRLQAFRIAVYLDDGLGVCPSFADCCSRSLGVKSDLFPCSIAGFLFFLPFCHSRKIFTDHFVTARVDFRIAFSIKFLSSSPLLGFRKVLDAMSSSVSRRKVRNMCEIRFSCILIYP